MGKTRGNNVMKDETQSNKEADNQHNAEECGKNHSESVHEKSHPKSRKWKLNVQGVIVTSDEPTILASDALLAAGFNPNSGWILILKVKGEHKKNIELDDEIDLRHHGIEKLRLTPKEIVNGDVAPSSQMDFALLEKDKLHLNKLGVCWVTIIDEGRRWLIIRDYALADGYNYKQLDIACEIPSTYPDAAIDMFYVFPALTLSNGRTITQTDSAINICDKSYQRWSRHLSGKTLWDPLTDSVITHLAVIDESLLREVGE